MKEKKMQQMEKQIPQRKEQQKRPASHPPLFAFCPHVRNPIKTTAQYHDAPFKRPNKQTHQEEKGNHHHQHLMQPLLQINNSRIPRTTPRAHIMRTPRTLDHRGNRPRDPQHPILHHRVGLGHALVQFRRHVMVEFAAAALDKHLGNRRHATAFSPCG